MRCPKCQYISFDRSERCRNCGYDFSLTVDVKDVDLPIQTGDEPLGPMSDLKLGDLDTSLSGSASGPRPSRPAGTPDALQDSSHSRRPSAPSSLDLPLFTGPGNEDAPLVTPLSVPRAPLSVRRATPPIARARTPADPREQEEQNAGSLDLGTPEPRVEVSHAVTSTPRDEGPMAAPLGRRLGAALIDASLLGAIDLTILYFTLKLCGLQVAEIAVIPVIPFGSFVLLLNAAYFVGFTAAGGQTIGKMAAGIRVVPFFADARGGDRVPFGLAVLRAAAYVISVLPAGLGFIPALLGSEHRALHDRLAETRVVKA